MGYHFRNATLLSVFASLCMSVAAAESRPPNIILIMADDLGYECIGANGSASYTTPHLDDLAQSGIRFTHCYAQPLCTPSRVQIMTGQYNFRNYREFGVLPPEETTFAHLLKKAGYATAVTGKWQLYGFDTKQARAGGAGSTPEQAGFDDYCLWQLKRPRSDGERYADPLISRSDSADQIVNDGYGPEVFCNFVLEFIEEKREQPFFVYYPMVLTHDPFVPLPNTPAWNGDRYADDTAHFAGMVAYMDAIVGRIVARLEQLGLRENTLLMFTGDNGSHRSIETRMDDGRLIRGDKGQPTDAGTHVPFIANWPGTAPADVVSDDLIDFTDFLPTLVDLAGASLPPNLLVDGRSFAPQLRGAIGNPREWVFCHYDPRWGGREPARFVRNHSWKLYDDGRFFDMQRDPREQEPLPKASLTPDLAAVRAQLQTVLDEFARQAESATVSRDGEN